MALEPRRRRSDLFASASFGIVFGGITIAEFIIRDLKDALLMLVLTVAIQVIIWLPGRRR